MAIINVGNIEKTIKINYLSINIRLWYDSLTSLRIKITYKEWKSNK